MSNSPSHSQLKTRKFGRRIWQFIRSHLRLFSRHPCKCYIHSNCPKTASCSTNNTTYKQWFFHLFSMKIMASPNLSEVVSKIQTIVLAQHKRIHASETKDIDEIPRYWTDPGNKNEHHTNGSSIWWNFLVFKIKPTGNQMYKHCFF